MMSCLTSIVLFALACAPIHAVASPAAVVAPCVRCKYSVRDVAFVNVHGKVWQLQLIKPANVQQKVFAGWNETLRTKLADANVGFVWHKAESTEAVRLAGKTSHSQEFPLMFLSGPGDTTISVLNMGNSVSFAQLIDGFVNSRARQNILNQLVNNLCVVLLVESGGEKDQAANDLVKSAVEQINKQMWTLEKPTDSGPVMVKVSAREKENEKWLLQSLGISTDNLPAVAVVYGQGRRLGEVLAGDDITLEKIVGRASVCGQDCECDLNRAWLYGQQMIHVWSKELERMAEASLSFDPSSAFVMAEVAQIIQKNAAGLAPNDRVNLGGGLVVHDLDPIANNQDPDSNTRSAKTEPDDLTTPVVILPGEVHTHAVSPRLAIPWAILIGLFVALWAVSFWLKMAARQR